MTTQLTRGKLASNWMQQHVLRVLKERKITIRQFPIPATQLARLLDAIQEGLVDDAQARRIFQQMLDQGSGETEIMATQQARLEADQENLNQHDIEIPNRHENPSIQQVADKPDPHTTDGRQCPPAE